LIENEIVDEEALQQLLGQIHLFFGSHLIEPITIKENVVLSVELSANQVSQSLNNPSGSNSFRHEIMGIF